MEARDAAARRGARHARRGCSALVPLRADRGGDRRCSPRSTRPGLGERRGPPVEELAVERTVLHAGRDRADGAQRRARRGRDRAGHGQRRLRRSSPAPSEPIGRLGDRDGAASQLAVDRGRGLRGRAAHLDRRRRSRTRSRSRSRRRTPTSASSALMALLGIYVGVIPVALGMLWLPWMRRIPPRWLRVLMALTVGLLAFLGDRRDARGLRARRRGLAGVRRRRARAARRARSPTWC